MDIVERLRSWRKDDVCAAADEAADEIERLRAVIRECDGAIKEYNRYFYGGEMRGSYDGKPERELLWKAGYTAAAIVKAMP
jgi:hypothetical protein